MIFHPQRKTLPKRLPTFTADEIEAEETYIGYWSPHLPKKSTGPITTTFLDNLTRLYGDDVEWIVDSRSYELLPGWWPCIPGWHLDDISRGTDGHPEIFQPRYKARHVLCVVDAGTGSTTQFIDWPASVPDTLSVQPGETLYGNVSSLIGNIPLGTYTAQSGEMIEYGATDWHRALPAKDVGHRFFIRATMLHTTERKPVNKIRHNTRVYVPAPQNGW